MLYDAFISHASEDKDEIVRSLAEGLRQHRVEVWYDEFALTPGTSLRRSIDAGLAKSRYGIVILSPHFFGKAWPEWELDGLVQRHLTGSQSVLIPIWHRVGRDEVAAHSPSLADVVAIPSSLGVDAVVRRLLRIIQPEESALVTARNLILERGHQPPVISDDWWLDAIEGAGYQDNQRWCFPVWRMSSDSSRRGERLAWIAMQHIWQEESETKPITQLTPPPEVIEFISAQPGLLEVCEAMPDVLLEFAPQLAISGCGGPIERAIETAYQRSKQEQQQRRVEGCPGGSALTRNGLCPACEDCFALRHPSFGDYDAANVACGYVIGNGAGLGPHTTAFPIIDYLIWFLSAKSHWLPRRQHAYLLQGMKDWAMWLWHGGESDSEYRGSEAGALFRWLTETKGHDRRRLPPAAASDVFDRINHCRELLGLPERTQELVDRFVAERIIEGWSDSRRQLLKRRARPHKAMNAGQQTTTVP